MNSITNYAIPIVVNDGSTDNTQKKAISEGAVVVNHQDNMGYDMALNSGFKKAYEIGCEIVITFDADGQHDHHLIPKYIKHIEQGYDLVCGNRQKKQRLGEVLFGVYTKYFFGIKDPLCGMKGYKISLFKKFDRFDSYGSVGTELALLSIKNNYKFKEVDVCTNERKDKPRFIDFFGGNYKIFRSLLLSFIYIKKYE